MAAMATVEGAGRPARFVDLGPLEGLATSRALRQRWRPAGIATMTVEDAVAALDRTHPAPSPVVGVWSTAG